MCLVQFNNILGILCLFNVIYALQSGRTDHEWYKEESWTPKPYSFGYEIRDADGNEQYRKEMSDGNRVTGSYGYMGPDGLYRHVEYIADQFGFRATVRTSEPGIVNDNPADVKIQSYSIGQSPPLPVPPPPEPSLTTPPLPLPRDAINPGNYDRNLNSNRNFDNPNLNPNLDAIRNPNPNRSPERLFDNSDGNWNRNSERNFNNNPDRDFDNNSGRNHNRDFDNNSNRNHNRDFNRSPEREFNRTPDVNFDNNHDRNLQSNFNRNPERQFDDNIDGNLNFDRDLNRNNENDANRNFNINPERNYNRNPENFNTNDRKPPNINNDQRNPPNDRRTSEDIRPFYGFQNNNNNNNKEQLNFVNPNTNDRFDDRNFNNDNQRFGEFIEVPKDPRKTIPYQPALPLPPPSDPIEQKMITNFRPDSLIPEQRPLDENQIPPPQTFRPEIQSQRPIQIPIDEPKIIPHYVVQSRLPDTRPQVSQRPQLPIPPSDKDFPVKGKKSRDSSDYQTLRKFVDNILYEPTKVPFSKLPIPKRAPLVPQSTQRPFQQQQIRVVYKPDKRNSPSTPPQSPQSPPSPPSQSQSPQSNDPLQPTLYVVTPFSHDFDPKDYDVPQLTLTPPTIKTSPKYGTRIQTESPPPSLRPFHGHRFHDDRNIRDRDVQRRADELNLKEISENYEDIEDDQYYANYDDDTNHEPKQQSQNHEQQFQNHEQKFQNHEQQSQNNEQQFQNHEQQSQNNEQQENPTQAFSFSQTVAHTTETALESSTSQPTKVIEKAINLINWNKYDHIDNAHW